MNARFRRWVPTRLTRMIIVLVLVSSAWLVSSPAAAFAFPATTIWGVPTGWSTSDVTVSFTTDKDPDPGIKTYYMLGSDGQVVYSGAFTVSTEGVTTLVYHSELFT